MRNPSFEQWQFRIYLVFVDSLCCFPTKRGKTIHRDVERKMIGGEKPWGADWAFEMWKTLRVSAFIIDIWQKRSFFLFFFLWFLFCVFFSVEKSPYVRARNFFIVLNRPKTYNLSARKRTSEENAYEENLSAVESEACQYGRLPRQNGRPQWSKSLISSSGQRQSKSCWLIPDSGIF